ncbi:hypothetical protein PSTT_06914 [Puccinia striiformis]|uniref:SWIM-type domain-containing protein n=1 Tax=Puccinia striiformis TaxID=27350 RepID=A0A2S4VIQ8_9BASI|nr:hypothetical protein PSTT_06914 [Puccinia striiformis]
MLQSLSDSLKVEAQAILDNFDPEKLSKINSFFTNCLGKISNFALQKAQHNFTQTHESSPPTTCTNSHTKWTGIPCKHRIVEVLELGLLAQPERFDTQWHLRHQGGLVGGLNSTEGGVGRRFGTLNTIWNVGTLNESLEQNVGTLNTIWNFSTLNKSLDWNVSRLIPLNSHSPTNQRTSSSSSPHP